MQGIHYISKSDLGRATRILLRALAHISTNYTARGFKVKTKDTPEPQTCLLGALDVASLELYSKHIRDDDLAVLLINSVALTQYKASAVTVSDDLGYAQVIRLFALTLERAFEDAARIGPNIGRVEYRSVGEPA